MRSRSFGSHLRRIREELNLSQIDVGEALGLAPSRISQIEKGHGIKAEDMGRLARFYGVSTDVFFRPPTKLTTAEIRAIRLFKHVLNERERTHIVDAVNSFVKNEAIWEHRFRQPAGK